ncbi:MAG: 1-acyl-sn-glycerol-3-phosphate acyltransferase [Gallionellaceae bacterium]|nr:1-acyl-sn-glycerol-3-phosphate acyltransferase [Gallionellaceae bacterium]
MSSEPLSIAAPEKNARPWPLSWLRLAQEFIAYYGGLLLFAVMCLFWSVVAYPLVWLLPEKFGTRLGRRTMMFGFSVYLRVLEATGVFRFDLDALDVLSRERPLIVAPNHRSLIDVVMIVSRLPNAVCIIKAALSSLIIYGGSVKLAHYILNDTQAGLIVDSVEEIQSGSQLLVFPEGTRAMKGQLLPFKGGFALIAKRANAPVQTVFIDSNHPFLCKDRPLWRKPEFPLHFRVRLGQRFDPPEDAQRFVKELEQYYRSQVTDVGGAARNENAR